MHNHECSFVEYARSVDREPFPVVFSIYVSTPSLILIIPKLRYNVSLFTLTSLSRETKLKIEGWIDWNKGRKEMRIVSHLLTFVEGNNSFLICISSSLAILVVRVLAKGLSRYTHKYSLNTPRATATYDWNTLSTVCTRFPCALLVWIAKIESFRILTRRLKVGVWSMSASYMSSVINNTAHRLTAAILLKVTVTLTKWTR